MKKILFAALLAVSAGAFAAPPKATPATPAVPATPAKSTMAKAPATPAVAAMPATRAVPAKVAAMGTKPVVKRTVVSKDKLVKHVAKRHAKSAKKSHKVSGTAMAK
jgi:hypothetical protein